MSDLSADDRRHLEREYDRLTGELIHYFDAIVTTERLVLAGAAAVAAFLYTDLPSFGVGQAWLLAGLPFAIVCLGGLRCLTIFLVMLEAGRYLRRIEPELLSRPDLGMQRQHSPANSPILWTITATTTAFWLFAVLASAYFWRSFAPAAET